jgi:hypothetical protein
MVCASGVLSSQYLDAISLHLVRQANGTSWSTGMVSQVGSLSIK